MKIEFKQDYIKRCYEAYQYSSFINPLMQNLEKGNSIITILKNLCIYGK